jgi:hypothetical protein
MTRTARTTQVVTVLLVALTMGLEFAHVLELGPRFGYPPQLYVQLTNTLYFWFGTLGAAVYVGSVGAAAALTWLVRHCGRTVASLTGAAAVLQLAALVSWLALIAPVNARLRAVAPGEVPDGFVSLRAQWEYTHTLGFVLFTAAFLLLVVSLVVPVTGRSRGDGPAARVREAIR